MRKATIHIITGAILSVMLMLLLFSKGCIGEQNISLTTTDTVYVDKPYKEIVIKEVEIVKPKTVYIYKTDTVFRKQMEKDTLISSIEFTPKLAKIHTITPKGIPSIKEYPLLDYKKIQIDHEGNTSIKRKKHPKRKKVLKTLTKIGFFVGGVWIGSQFKK